MIVYDSTSPITATEKFRRRDVGARARCNCDAELGDVLAGYYGPVCNPPASLSSQLDRRRPQGSKTVKTKMVDNALWALDNTRQVLHRAAHQAQRYADRARATYSALSPRTHWMRRLHQLWPSRWEDLLRARDPVVSS